MAVRLFEKSTHAHLYAKFRPAYPRAVLEAICKFITKRSGGFELAVDVACGPGNSTFHLCNTFNRCIGIDISSAQIDEGVQKARELGVRNVEFKVASATKLPVEDSSTDLVACAQAWHWVDPDDLYREAERVLRPNACLAVYGYGNCQLANKECHKLVSHFYSHTLQGYWNARRRHVDDLYRQCKLPYEDTERLDMEFPMTLELPDFIGYLSSWSAYQKYLEENPGTTVLTQLQDGIRAILQPTASDQPPLVDMTFPVFVILGKK